ncbi:MAG TPA: lipopolysaccharide heptosyltransferase II [Dissulfurispiraceae bacterium]|nr:lipopolysaccharide heptosyltransferase II [Dissulfurispiraceae bacterium]
MMEGETTEKILVREVNWIGDAVMTLPAVRAIRKQWPGAKISILVKPAIAPLFENNPDVDEVLLYEERFSGMIGKLRLSSMLRSMRYAKAILLQNAFDAALITFLARIPERIGYARDSRQLLLTKPVHYNSQDRKIHHIQYYLDLLRASGINAECSHPWLRLSLKERLAARATLSCLKQPILGINPGATYGSSKRWIPKRFAEIAGWFIGETRGSVVIFGGKNEMTLAEEIFTNVPMNKLLLAGKTSLRELIALISECDVFVTNDSGPMHIAYAVGTPLAAIFGSTSAELTGPVGEGHSVIKADLDCAPCFKRSCDKDYIKCMFGVTSEEVYRSIRNLLPTKKAVFFDRDGTLCNDANYLNRWEDFVPLPGVERLKLLKEEGFELIGVSNQSGIAKGIIREDFVKEVNRLYIDMYGFTDFYYCPHAPIENCTCRKPEPGMLIKARSAYGIDLKKSFVVGDKDADMLLAKAVGAKGILVRTGQQDGSDYADAIVDDLDAAIKYIRKWSDR